MCSQSRTGLGVGSWYEVSIQGVRIGLTYVICSEMFEVVSLFRIRFSLKEFCRYWSAQACSALVKPKSLCRVIREQALLVNKDKPGSLSRGAKFKVS